MVVVGCFWMVGFVGLFFGVVFCFCWFVVVLFVFGVGVVVF